MLLDLYMASNTFAHGIFLDCLSLTGSTLSSQVGPECDAENCCSSPALALDCSLSYGVPQDSILFPMLFDRYIKLLGEVVRVFGPQSCQCADDIPLYYLSIPSNPSETPESGSGGGNELDEDKLKLNPDKTAVQ